MLFILSLIAFPFLSFSQKREVLLNGAGENLSEIVSGQMQYVFPDFTDGVVYSKVSGNIKVKLNYNMLLGEMHFITQEGEVLALGDLKNIFVVTIGERKFYPFKDKEFTEELGSKGKTGLRVRRKTKTGQHSKQVAFGGQSSLSSVTTVQSMNTEGKRFDLKTAENVIVSIDNAYYLVDNGKFTLIKNMKAFTKQFSNYKTQIEVFVKEHHIDINKEEDLLVLLEYCNSLE